MNKHHYTKAEREEWLRKMRNDLPPGSVVTTVLRHRSPSGMTHAIDAYKLSCDDDGKVVKSWLSYRVAAILGWPYSERYEAVGVGGAGMDMGYHLSKPAAAADAAADAAYAAAAYAADAILILACRIWREEASAVA